MHIEKGKFYRAKAGEFSPTLSALGFNNKDPKKCLFIGKVPGKMCSGVSFEGQKRFNSMAEFAPEYTGLYYNVEDRILEKLEEVVLFSQEEFDL